jgi:hypothetical protein
LRLGNREAYVGKTAMVCGAVASTKLDAHLRSRPTFLDFAKLYPNQVFTAVIFERDRAKFGTPETTYEGKRVCVTGQVRNYRGKPEIIVSDSSQLTE